MWLFLAIGSYFLGAVTVILDKYLLSSEKVSTPATYAFYVGILGLGVIIFWPLAIFSEAFVLSIPSISQTLLSFAEGIFFLAAITAMYFAIKKSEASKVTPIVFSVVPIVSFLLGYFQGLEKFSLVKISGVFLLIFGGLLISFDLPLKLNKRKFFAGFYLSLFAGFLWGISTFLLKLVYEQQNFFNGYVWTRAGSFLGAFLLLLYPVWRVKIFNSFKHAHKNKKENLQTGGLFVSNKIIGGTSSALFNLAIGLGSVTLVNSLISLQYVFVLIIAVLVAKKMPHIFEERLFFWDWAQKVAAIFVIAIGMYFIT